MPENLVVVHVHVHVKPEAVDAFRRATLANAEQSLLEPGVVRFDVIQDAEDPTRFVLVEVFRDTAAGLAHKEMPHYATWRDAVAGLMAEPRAAKKYISVFPDHAEW